MSQTETSKSLLYVKIFVVCVLVVSLLVLIVRLYGSFVNRSYLSDSFNTIIVTDSVVGVAGIDSESGKTSLLLVKNPTNELKNASLTSQSIQLGIPLHAAAYYGDNPIEIQDFFSPLNLKNVLFSSGITVENIAFFDALKMYLAARSEVQSGISYNNIDHLQQQFPDADPLLFQDANISAIKTSMAVVNGTGVDGVGGRLAGMYDRVGFNVIAIDSQLGVETSQIYVSGEHEQEVAFIRQTFDFPIKYNDPRYNVADITIVLGEDSALNLENL